MDENEKYSYQAVADEMDTVCTDTTSDALGVLLASLKLLILLELFRATYRGKMAVFWDSYIDLVCLLLRFTRAMQGDHLLTAEQKSNDALTTFVEKRLQTSDVDLFAPLAKAKLHNVPNPGQRKPKPLKETCLRGWSS